MPALLLRLFLQCADDIEMNPGPVSTPTPTNCLRLMQWNANGIGEKITELLTFLHNNNVNIAAIQETKLTNKTRPLKTPGWAAVRLDRHKNQGGGLLMLIKDTIPFVDSSALFHSQSNLIRSNMAFRLRCQIANNCTSCVSLQMGEEHKRRRKRRTASPRNRYTDYTILIKNEATRLPTNGRSTSPNISLTSNDIVLLSYWSASPHWPAIISPSSSPSTPNCSRLMGLSEPM